MTSAELSRLHYIACSRAQEVLTELYEELHDYEGVPIMDADKDWFKQKIQSAVKEIRTELSLISSAIEE